MSAQQTFEETAEVSEEQSFLYVELKNEPLDDCNNTEDEPRNYLDENIDIKDEKFTPNISESPESCYNITTLKKPAVKKGKRKKNTNVRAKRQARGDPHSDSTSKQAETTPESQSRAYNEGISEIECFVKIEMIKEEPETPPYREASPVPHKRRRIGAGVNYGSEDDTDDEADGEDGARQPVVIPRASRVFFDLEEAEDTTETRATENSPETDKHNFDWQPLSKYPVLPFERRTPFQSGNCGPTGSFPTPYDAFKAIWSRDIVEHIAYQTNRYAQQLTEDMMMNGTLRPTSRITDWRDATADEIYMFFAIILATGVVVKSRLEEYWNKEPFLLSTPEFTNTMTYDRFILLNKCLHFQDNDLVNEREMPKSEAKLFKVQPVIDHLNEKFVSLFNLGQNVALDESLTQWKGSADTNVFSKSKSTSHGIKVYEICDCHTGYLWRFEANARSDTATVETTSSIILRLLRGVEQKGHTIWMDASYSSPLVARELKAQGFDCVGTLRTNKQFVPKEMIGLEKTDLKPDELVGFTSGDVDVLAWRDRKIVTLISTYHGLATVETADNRKPAVMYDYVNCISKVDRKDQMLAAHPIERKRTRVWYKKFFRRLLNASVLNAYILHRHNPKRLNPSISHREFRKMLIVQIIKYHMPAKASVNSTDHFPNEYGKNLESKAKKLEGLRRKCAVCKRRTRNYCEGCNTAMCLYACFKQYHSSRREVPGDEEIVTGS